MSDEKKGLFSSLFGDLGGSLAERMRRIKQVGWMKGYKPAPDKSTARDDYARMQARIRDKSRAANVRRGQQANPGQRTMRRISGRIR